MIIRNDTSGSNGELTSADNR